MFNFYSKISIFLRSILAIIVLSLVFAFLIVGCGPTDATPTPAEAQPVQQESYPAPNLEDTSGLEGYPAPSKPPDSEQGYPIPTPAIEIESAYPSEDESSDGILLTLKRPISSTDQAIEGLGPAGLPVIVLNITFMGELIGTALVQEDGTFSIPIDGLEPGVQVGLTADIEGFGLTFDDIIPGEGEFNVPQVGYFFDTTVVNEN